MIPNANEVYAADENVYRTAEGTMTLCEMQEYVESTNSQTLSL